MQHVQLCILFLCLAKLPGNLSEFFFFFLILFCKTILPRCTWNRREQAYPEFTGADSGSRHQACIPKTDLFCFSFLWKMWERFINAPKCEGLMLRIVIIQEGLILSFVQAPTCSLQLSTCLSLFWEQIVNFVQQLGDFVVFNKEIRLQPTNSLSLVT